LRGHGRGFSGGLWIPLGLALFGKWGYKMAVMMGDGETEGDFFFASGRPFFPQGVREAWKQLV
jgi:hypothetical protein